MTYCVILCCKLNKEAMNCYFTVYSNNKLTTGTDTETEQLHGT